MENKWLIWICGGIDYNGRVVGHAYWSDDPGEIACHTKEEKATGSTWRVCGRHKELMESTIPHARQFTKEEIFKIEDWLFKNGFLKEQEELHDAGTIRFQEKIENQSN